MATSKKREDREQHPARSDKDPADKPKSSAGRKVVLLLLLVAAIAVFALDFLPEEDAETKVVGPAKRHKAPVQSPAQPQGQQPATPQQREQPKTSPTPPPATPPRYERPSETILVSSSPSDAPVPVETALVGAAEPPAVAPAPEGTPAGGKPPEQASPTPAPAETVAVAAPSSDNQAAAAEPKPVVKAAAETETPAAPAVTETAPPAPSPAETPQLVASRTPAPPVPVQENPEPVIVADKEEPSPQPVARPLPEGPIPPKVGRYAQRIFDRYDANGDGAIDATERRDIQGDPATIDYNADGNIRFEELAAYMADYGRHRRMRLTGSMVEEAVAELPPLYIPTAELDAMAAAQAAAQQAAQQAQAVPVALAAEPANADSTAHSEAEKADDGAKEADETTGSEQPQPATSPANSKRFVTPKSRLAGLPEWFLARDANGDGQLTAAEYAPNSEKSALADFARYDRNNDGVLTPQECPKKK
ncbi:MAG: hypothetical protein GXX96_00985 [Planctomycetaceae bacterium]|nr:hypothetical protein [Planctomycetaceae bacterium]